MQHVRLVIFTVLLTACAFQVDGDPVFNKYEPKSGSPQQSSKGYFGYLRDGELSPPVSKAPSRQSSGIQRPHKYAPGNDRSPQQLSKGYFGYIESSTGNIPESGGSESGQKSPGGGGIIAGGVSALGAVGGGIASGVGGIVSGISELGTGSLNHLANALSAVTPESLTKVLGLGDLTQSIADKVDVTGVLSNVISGQANPLNGVMNFETASVVLEKFGGLVPGLAPSVKAIKTVSHVMNEIKSIKNENGQVDPTKLMVKAADLYFSDVDPNYKKKLIELGPLVAQAATGDTSAATQIATSLIDRNTVLEGVKAMGYKTQVELVQNVINQASDYAKMVKGAAGAAQKLSGMVQMV